MRHEIRTQSNPSISGPGTALRYVPGSFVCLGLSPFGESISIRRQLAAKVFRRETDFLAEDANEVFRRRKAGFFADLFDCKFAFEQELFRSSDAYSHNLLFRRSFENIAESAFQCAER